MPTLDQTRKLEVMGQGPGFGERELLRAPHIPKLPAEVPLPHLPRPNPLPDGQTVPGGSHIGANGLGVNHGGPSLSGIWNQFFGGSRGADDGRGYLANHIGHSDGNMITGEGSVMSQMMRHTPYVGDYWEALAKTHDSAGYENRVANAVTAFTNVGLPGPMMALADAPFRMFGSSMFLGNK